MLPLAPAVSVGKIGDVIFALNRSSRNQYVPGMSLVYPCPLATSQRVVSLFVSMAKAWRSFEYSVCSSAGTLGLSKM